MFVDEVAMQSCTWGRNALFHRRVTLAYRHDPVATPGQPVLLAARHAGARQVPARSSVTPSKAVGTQQKTGMSRGGTLGGPLTACQYDWNMLPIGQQMWLEQLSSYEKSRRCRRQKATNLSQVIDQVKASNATHSSDEAADRAPPAGAPNPASALPSGKT